MIDAIKHIDEIDRFRVRKRAELYFSVEKMVSEQAFQQDKRDRKALENLAAAE